MRMLGGCVRVKRECNTVSTAFKTHCIWWTEVEFRLLGGCVRVKRECNTTFQHLKYIALYGQR
jgi:hypothetical protein